jgi:hypothetical protein
MSRCLADELGALQTMIPHNQLVGTFLGVLASSLPNLGWELNVVDEVALPHYTTVPVLVLLVSS